MVACHTAFPCTFPNQVPSVSTAFPGLVIPQPSPFCLYSFPWFTSYNGLVIPQPSPFRLCSLCLSTVMYVT